MTSTTRRRRSSPWTATLAVAAFVALAELDVGTFVVDANGSAPLRERAAVAAVLASPVVLVGARSAAMRRLAAQPHVRWMLAWSAWGVLTTFWSITPLESVTTASANLGLFVLGAWYVATRGFHRFAIAFVTGACAFMAVGLPGDLRRIVSGSFVRFSGWAVLWTDLSRLALVTVLLAVACLSHRQWRGWPMWWALVFSSGVFVGTATRTTTIALVVALAMIATTRWGLGRVVVAGITVALVVGVPLLTLDHPGELVKRQEDRRDLQDVNGRRGVWSATADLIADRPLEGHGVGSAPLLLGQATSSGLIHFEARHAHDLLMQVLLTDGLVGAGLLVTAFASYARRRPNDAVAGAIVVAVLISGLTEGVVDRPTAIVMLWGALFAERAVISSRSARSPRALPADPLPSGDTPRLLHPGRTW